MNDTELEERFVAWRADPDNLMVQNDLWELLLPFATAVARGLMGSRCLCGRTATDLTMTLVGPPKWLRESNQETLDELKGFIRLCLRRRWIDLLRASETRSTTGLGHLDPPVYHRPEVGLERDDLRIRLDAAVGALDADDQLLWRMRFTDEANYEEIAVVFGITKEAARVRFHRIKKAVFDTLGGLP